MWKICTHVHMHTHRAYTGSPAFTYTLMQTQTVHMQSSANYLPLSLNYMLLLWPHFILFLICCEYCQLTVTRTLEDISDHLCIITHTESCTQLQHLQHEYNSFLPYCLSCTVKGSFHFLGRVHHQGECPHFPFHRMHLRLAKYLRKVLYKYTTSYVCLTWALTIYRIYDIFTV